MAEVAESHGPMAEVPESHCPMARTVISSGPTGSVVTQPAIVFVDGVFAACCQDTADAEKIALHRKELG